MKAKKTVLQVLECLRKHVVQLHQPTVMHISIRVIKNSMWAMESIVVDRIQLPVK